MTGKGFLAGALATALFSSALAAEAPPTPLPRIVGQDGHFALEVDGQPFLMLGSQVNNSSNYPAALPKVWPVVDALGGNMVEVPVAWEQIEPTEGRFDFSWVDTLLAQARTHDRRLVLLWFGTWKNTNLNYTPAWVKLDPRRFPHAIDAKGEEAYGLSPFGAATLAADTRAFAALLAHLKAVDPQNTVIMVQVENETGSYGNVRDHSPAAERAFAGPVPAAIVRAMGVKPGTWRAAFGDKADEYFAAWSIARYVDAVARAGKAVKPLPMYVNAALSDPFKAQEPTSYAAGGPNWTVIPIWKAAAPALDLVAPDIYTADHARYIRYLDLYARKDNPLFVPETGNAAAYARYVFAALGRGAIGFAPFGMDATGYSNYPLGARQLDAATIEAFAAVYRLFRPLDHVWPALALQGKTWGVAEPTDPAAGHRQVIDLGRWQATVSYGQPQFGTPPPAGNDPVSGGAAIAEIGPDSYLVTGLHARVTFALAHPRAHEHMLMLRVEEGHYDVAGRWVFERVWNGDQTDYGLNFTSAPHVLHVTLATYR